MFDFDLSKRTQERYDTLRNESDEWRLVKLATTGRPAHTLLHSRALAQVGTWLIAWGWRLRARYGELERTAAGEPLTAAE